MRAMLTIGNPLNFADLARFVARRRQPVDFGRRIRRDRPRRGRRGPDRAARRARLWREHRLWPACADAYSQRSARAAADAISCCRTPWASATPLPAPVVRLMLALKIATLARGYSGVRRELVDALVKLYNADVLPRMPSKGSVGASGDLAPLAHLSTVLLGVGEVECGGKILSADEGLKRAGLDAHQARGQGRPRIAQWHADLDRARARAISSRSTTCTPRRSSPARCRWTRPKVRRARSTRASTSCAAIPGQIAAAAAYRELLAGQPHQLQSSRMRQGAGSLLAALPAAGHGRLQRPDRSGARRAAARGERGHRQSAGLHRTTAPTGRGALRRQLPRRAGGVRGRQSRARGGRDRRAVRAAHRAAHRRHAVRPAAVPRAGRRREFGFHDRARDRRGAGVGEQTARASRRAWIRCPPPRTRKTTCPWRRSRRASSAICARTPRSSSPSSCWPRRRASTCARRISPRSGCSA